MVQEILKEQILHDYEDIQGIQEENESYVQEQINYTSYILRLPLANFVVGQPLSEACDYSSRIVKNHPNDNEILLKREPLIVIGLHQSSARRTRKQENNI